MGLNLTKGQSLSLTKTDGAALTRIRLGLGWDTAAPAQGLLSRLFGQPAPEIDLDASAIFFDRSGTVLDTIWFNQLASKDGSARHTGDNLTGEGDGDDETIMVDLSQVSSEVEQIVFVISSYTRQTFDAIDNAFCRVLDDSAPGSPEVARYQLTDSGPHTAMIIAKVVRTGAGWDFTAIGERANGRSVMDLLVPAAQAL
jgi:tellurium resistance protein TerZ